MNLKKVAQSLLIAVAVVGILAGATYGMFIGIDFLVMHFGFFWAAVACAAVASVMIAALVYFVVLNDKEAEDTRILEEPDHS